MKLLQRLFLIAFCGLVPLAGLTKADVHGPSVVTASRVEKLIQRLGAADYTLRQQAREELKLIGYPAFDLLLQAQYHADAEVSLAARKLISQFTIKWVQPEDPGIVAHILRDYQRFGSELRAERAKWLAELEDGVGTRALFRVVRYEPSEVVAKQAALAFLENVDPKDDLQWVALSAAMADELNDAERQPVRWLKAFAHDAQAAPPNQLATWKLLAEEEIALAATPRSSRLVAADLTQHYASKAYQQHDLAAVKSALAHLMELRQGNDYQTLRTAHWLLDHQLANLFEDFAKQVKPADTKNPRFAYCRAESLLQQDKPELAEEAAEQAFQLTVAGDQYVDPLWTTDERFRTAVSLEQRGLISWSLREYERVIEQPILHILMADRRERSIKLKAELLHDRGRDKEAAETLAKLVGDTNTVVFPNNDLDEETAGLISRMYYFRAEHFRQQGDRQRQIEFLRKAVQADPTDADVLIAMYRLPRSDAAWQQMTRDHIREAVKIFEERLQRLRGDGLVANRSEIAIQLNQIAWLVGNTEGNQRLAVQQSRRSLELQPKSAGSLDTLGRTYFAVGDLENALKYQRRAVDILPHSLQIERQLREFESVAATRKERP